MNYNFIDVDFHHGIPSHSIIDKKNGVRINIGRATLPKDHEHLGEQYGFIMLGIQESGMGQGQLDQMCNFMALNSKSLGLELMVTKSDRPFDSQWYFLGNIEGLLRSASQGAIRPPFSNGLHDRIASALQIVIRKN